jgi:hypothetical protein
MLKDHLSTGLDTSRSVALYFTGISTRNFHHVPETLTCSSAAKLKERDADALTAD